MLQPQRVSAGVWAAVDERLVSNIAAVVLPDYLVVVDTGKNPPLAAELRRTWQQQFDRPVRYAVVTHYHVDHTAGLSAFADVEVVGSARVAEKLPDLPEWAKAEMAALQSASAGAVPPVMVAPSLTFTEGLTLGEGQELELRYCGGHTDCSIYGYLPDDRVLLAGDLVVVDEFPFPGDVSVDPEVWMAALQEWMRLDIEHVIPGHGPVSGPDCLAMQLELLQTLKENTLAALRAGRDHTSIEVPVRPPVATGHGWFVGRFRERWYEYYRDRCES